MFRAGARSARGVGEHAAGCAPQDDAGPRRRGLLGDAGPELSDRDFLTAHGVRIALQGHMPFYAAAKAAYETLKHLREGDPAELKTKTASDELLEVTLRLKDYAQWQNDDLQ